MRKISGDALLLILLVLARVRIDTLAQLVLPQRHQDVARLPLTRLLLGPEALELLRDWLTDPLSLLLISLTFGLTMLYLVADALKEVLGEVRTYRVKLMLLYSIIFTSVVASSALLIMLRHISGPASYTHDGGVIQTEEAIKFFLNGRNPYVEDYTNTPMAEWGLDYKTALYHFPYLPWTFVFSSPFYLASRQVLGWYDQRFVYLLLFTLMLLLAPGLARKRGDKLSLVAVLGLNPIMGVDIIFGQNDSFVLFWVVLSVWCLLRIKHPGGPLLSSAALAMACASKPTAWFLVPFYALYLWKRTESWRETAGVLGTFVLVGGLVVLPFALWNIDAMVDDIWRWSSGTAEISYQIRGWGVANFVLALGLVESRLSYFPFWILEAAFSVPLMAFLTWRQLRHNTLSDALWGYGLLLLVFLYFSRFLNENYLGYILAILALAYWVED